MKIMAGLDDSFNGEAFLKQGATVGYLSQGQLDPNLTVKENIELGVQPIRDLLKEFDAVSEAFGEEDADFDKLLERQARLRIGSMPATPGTWIASSISPWTPARSSWRWVWRPLRR